MIHFALAIGAPGACSHLGERLAEAVADTTLLGGPTVRASSPTGAWSLAAIAAPDPFLADRWHADGEAVAVCNGPVTGPRDLVEVLTRFRGGGRSAATSGLGGTYNLICLAPEEGLLATGDFTGLHPLYHGTDGEITVLSNRSTTIGHSLGASDWDLDALGWLVGQGHLAGTAVPTAGVRCLRPGRALTAPWARLGTLTELAPEPPIWPVAADGPGRDDLDPATWDEITEELVERVRVLDGLDTPLHLGLTGGKDSRLLLALASAAGMTRVRTFTSGAADSPEVACARDLAATAGFVHSHTLEDGARTGARRTAVRHTPPDGSRNDVLWRRMAEANGRYEGIVPTWSGLKNPDRPAATIIKGWGGELYRRGGRNIWRERQATDVAAMTDLFHEVIDPLEVLTAAERSRQRDWLAAWVTTTAAEVRLDLLPEVFYVDERLAHWNGPLTQDVPARIIANPLPSAFAARHNARLSARARAAERLPFEVMRRAAPALVGLPFLGQTWDPDLRRTSPIPLAADSYGTARPLRNAAGRRAITAYTGLRRSSVGRRARATGRRAVGRLAGNGARGRWNDRSRGAAWPLLEREPDAVVTLFEAAAPLGLGHICEVDRLAALVRDPSTVTRGPEVEQLFAAIGVAMLLLGRSDRVIDHPPT